MQTSYMGPGPGPGPWEGLRAWVPCSYPILGLSGCFTDPGEPGPSHCGQTPDSHFQSEHQGTMRRIRLHIDSLKPFWNTTAASF